MVAAALALLMGMQVGDSAAAQSRIGGDQPTRFPARMSPDGSWRAWLQRTGGGIQPIYYSVMVHHVEDPDARPCAAATATGRELERRIALQWSAPNRLVVRHSLIGDTAGTFNGIRRGCGDVYVRIVNTARMD